MRDARSSRFDEGGRYLAKSGRSRERSRRPPGSLGGEAMAKAIHMMVRVLRSGARSTSTVERSVSRSPTGSISTSFTLVYLRNAEAISRSS